MDSRQALCGWGPMWLFSHVPLLILDGGIVHQPLSTLLRLQLWSWLMTSQECVWFEPSMTTDNSMILTRLRKKWFFQTDSNSKISLSWYKCQVYCLLYWKLKYLSSWCIRIQGYPEYRCVVFHFLAKHRARWHSCSHGKCLWPWLGFRHSHFIKKISFNWWQLQQFPLIWIFSRICEHKDSSLDQ